MSEAVSPLSSTVFAPLGNAGRAEVAAQRIAAAIALGLVSDGEQLPSEAELSAQLGIATVTLREALATLRQQGLVETRRGRHGGTFVRTPRAEATRLLTDRLARMTVGDLRDLGDEHVAIAGTAAYLAAERASEADLARLEEFNQELRAADTHWHQCRADSHFHVQIAVAARSERLTRAEVRLQAESVEYLWITDEREPDLRSAVRSHEVLLEAIVGRDPDGARDLAQKHVRKNIAFISALHDRVSRDTMT